MNLSEMLDYLELGWKKGDEIGIFEQDGVLFLVNVSNKNRLERD